MEKRLKKVAVRWAVISFVSVLVFWLAWWAITGRMPQDASVTWSGNRSWEIPVSRLFDAFIGPLWILLISRIFYLIGKYVRDDKEDGSATSDREMAYFLTTAFGLMGLCLWLYSGLVTGIIGFTLVILGLLAFCIVIIVIVCAMYLIAAPLKLLGETTYKKLIIPGIRQIDQSVVGPKIARAINYLTGND